MGWGFMLSRRVVKRVLERVYVYMREAWVVRRFGHKRKLQDRTAHGNRETGRTDWTRVSVIRSISLGLRGTRTGCFGRHYSRGMGDMVLE